MSLVDGVHCALAECGRLSFLPLRCASCTAKFCEQHFLPEQHRCAAPGAQSRSLSDAALAARMADANSGSSELRVPCQKPGCKRFSLQVNSSSKLSHTAPRCERCGALFCMTYAAEADGADSRHRSVAAHGCTAPAPRTEGQKRLDAAQARKEHARKVLAKHFPERQ